MNKKMNIIDLANKLRNPIQIPKRVKHKDTIYTYDAQRNNYYYCDHQIYISTCLKDILNDEVEILEDNTEEIEEIGEFVDLIGMNENEEVLFKMIRCCTHKIDEIIKAINSIRKDKNND